MRFDIRSQLVAFLAVCAGTFVAASVPFEAAMMALVAVLQLLSGRTGYGKRVVSVGLLSTYALLIVMQFAVMPELPHAVSVGLSIPVVQLRKSFPLVMALVWIMRTATPAQIMATLGRMGFPKALTVTFSVTLRYFPSIAEEWSAVCEAMKLRRIQVMRGNPVSRALCKAECYAAPMLAAASRTSDELAAAASCRGVDNPARPTCLAYRAPAARDGVLAAASVAACVAAILVRMWT